MLCLAQPQGVLAFSGRKVATPFNTNTASMTTLRYITNDSVSNEESSTRPRRVFLQFAAESATAGAIMMTGSHPALAISSSTSQQLQRELRQDAKRLQSKTTKIMSKETKILKKEVKGLQKDLEKEWKKKRQ